MSGNLFDTAAVLFLLAAVFGLINHHLLKLPFTIGLMLSALSASIATLVLDAAFPGLGLGDSVRQIISSIDFTEALMHGMLGFLLFAGALHVDLGELLDRKGPILVLSSFGLALSAAILGLGSFGIFTALDVHVPLTYCLVFGALISPTDPIAVLGIMKSIGAPKSLEIKVAGESLFNDGFAVVLFAVLLAIANAAGGGDHHAAEAAADAAHHGPALEFGAIAWFTIREVLGGIVLGLLGGYLTFQEMRRIDEPNLEMLLSVALVMGLTAIAFRLHTSAPLACVVAGLLIGNRGRRLAMSDRTRNALDIIWSFLDEAMNAILFLLVGLEVLSIPFEGTFLIAAALLIPLALLGRWISVSIPILLMKRLREFPEGTIRVLTWGGLKGGISVALALSLPEFPGRGAVITATYAVVVFSILVQGLTIGKVIERVTVADDVVDDSGHPSH